MANGEMRSEISDKPKVPMNRSDFLHLLPFLEPTYIPPIVTLTKSSSKRSESTKQTNSQSHVPRENGSSKDTSRTTRPLNSSSSVEDQQYQILSCGNAVSLEPRSYLTGQCVGPCFFPPPSPLDVPTSNEDGVPETIYDEALASIHMVVGPPAPLRKRKNVSQYSTPAPARGSNEIETQEASGTVAKAPSTPSSPPPPQAAPSSLSTTQSNTTSPNILDPVP